ncbi:RecBCD enzyme subunit RecD [Planctomycetes bacterium Pan216]|uniref:RecBCD enzyme subunit RecD n=2 Tax=Kolteria novifilia TaxID=2527975 RepID=A0A518B0T8_9BACT|nr:RecBCD enzyme subunit RecD [Planctomycetes bacterium Pan216]
MSIEPTESLMNGLAERVSELNVDPPAMALAWELARLQSGDPHANELFLLALLLIIAQQQGSTRLPLADSGAIAETLRVLLPNDDAPLDAEEVARTIVKRVHEGAWPLVVGRDGDFKPLLFLDGHLYSQRMHALELSFTNILNRWLETGSPQESDRIDQAIGELERAPIVAGETPMTLTAEQTKAVAVAARGPLAIISGGPGTGKTTIVLSILRVLSRLGIEPTEVALAAPTGKAANRLESSILGGIKGLVKVQGASASDADVKLLGMTGASTLHRLLGYSPRTGRYLHHEQNQLRESVIIVDEASMVDLAMMERLAKAIRRNACLLLLGDADQLPSVAAGAALRDLTSASGSIAKHVVRLRESHRMKREDPAGREILGAAQQINRGEFAYPFTVLDESSPIPPHVAGPRDGEWRLAGFNFLETPSGDEQSTLNTFLERWHERFHLDPQLTKGRDEAFPLAEGSLTPEDSATLRQLFTHLGTFRLLCLTRVFPTGTATINEFFHQRWSPPEQRTRRVTFHPGEPIMMLENDYEHGVFNGDVGVVIRTREHGATRLMVAFDKLAEVAIYPIDAFADRIDLAFAVTIHKSQGSEFDHVGIVLPLTDLPLLSREMLYTGITRSRTSATVIGGREVFHQGIARRIVRSTGIAERLSNDAAAS